MLMVLQFTWSSYPKKLSKKQYLVRWLQDLTSRNDIQYVSIDLKNYQSTYLPKLQKKFFHFLRTRTSNSFSLFSQSCASLIILHQIFDACLWYTFFKNKPFSIQLLLNYWNYCTALLIFGIFGNKTLKVFDEISDPNTCYLVCLWQYWSVDSVV